MPLMGTVREPEGLAVLDPEAANIAAAIDRAVATAPEDALRFCSVLFIWWRATGRFLEAEAAYARTLAVSAGQPPQAVASVLWSRSYIALGSGNLEAGTAQPGGACARREGRRGRNRRPRPVRARPGRGIRGPGRGAGGVEPRGRARSGRRRRVGSRERAPVPGASPTCSRTTTRTSAVTRRRPRRSRTGWAT